jgi:hypothetical protein
MSNGTDGNWRIRSLASILFLALAATAAGAGEKIELYVATDERQR